jgi:hypothetical protein
MAYTILKTFSRHSLAAAFLPMILLSGGTLAQQPAPPQSATEATYPAVDGVKIERVEFGVFRDLNSPNASLDAARTVTRNARPVGWVVALDTAKSSVRWREEFSMPVPPAHWGLKTVSTDLHPPTLSADRRTVTTERLVPVRGGTVAHWWTTEASDPTGPHSMRVYVEDVLVGSFEFDVN